MTDTDELKRLADESLKYDPTGWKEVAFKEPEALAILALIAENEVLRDFGKSLLRGNLRLQRERDEAVALLRDHADVGNSLSYWADVHDFLARIDAAE